MSVASQRLLGLIRKEFLQVLRDPSSLAIAFAMPVFLLLLFGYGVSLDARRVPIGLVIEHVSPASRSFSAGFDYSDYFQAHYFRDMREARQALLTRKINAIVHLQADFDQRLTGSEPAPIQVIVNGVDANTARLTSGYVQGVFEAWLNARAAWQGQEAPQPVQLAARVWYNSALRSRNFLVPGLIAVIMTLIGALLTALVMAREWERGTMEALISTPVSVREVLLGKLIPYYLLGMGGMLLSISMAVFLFQVPLVGSLWVLLVAGTLFLLAALGMGLLISIAAKNQFVAGQIAIVVTFLPAFILSGFIFNIDSMPWAVQLFTHLVAARYFVAILQTVFLAGNIWEVILPNALALLLMASAFLALALWRAPRRLE
ncbi:ABC transporter permease [Methylomonas fluvii]|uniref:ABC transporter permease n=1 Tax=Methylomonas fluvii TaxID=1854564 RepID=A0ABR9DH89_9GAMM|nr:ABC transporter permease [Methylomonas fluvii]MBD9362156.1 ABC transporter permease [Methylomonas fluvii]CAD6875197.1 ABC-type efflux pump permease component YbhS [Methylomonas fluvii]